MDLVSNIFTVMLHPLQSEFRYFVNLYIVPNSLGFVRLVVCSLISTFRNITSKS